MAQKQMITTKQLSLSEVDWDLNLELNELTRIDGYMAFYLACCMMAKYHDKDDFFAYIAVAEEDGDIVGWVLVQDLVYRYKDFVELQIFVHENHRGKGVGSKLLEQTLADLPNKKIIAWASDFENKALYKKFKDRISVLDMAKYDADQSYVEYQF
jgi:GNAT superfamily N-acetyltransferase